MRSSTVIALLALCVAVAHPSDAYATSGWEHYSVDIEDRYRIYWARGIDFVAQLDAGGNLIDPPLIDMTNHQGFSGPPDFIVTSTHIVVRYQSYLPRSVKDDPKRLYFAIRKRDALVNGPLTDDAFSNSSVDLGESLHWNTPSTAADSFGRSVIVFLVLIACLALSPIIFIVFLIYLWLRRRKVKSAAMHNADV